MNISIVNTRAMKNILALNVVVPVTIKKMKMIFQNAFKMKTYPFPVICEPECYPLGHCDVEPCNCLCYQDEIEDLELDCNNADDDFWMDRREDYFLTCEPACYSKTGRKASCSCLCYTDHEQATIGQNCMPYDGPIPIYYNDDDDFQSNFYCDAECWEGDTPSKDCDCICFNSDHKGGDTCVSPPPPQPLTCEPACYDVIKDDEQEDYSLCSCLCYASFLEDEAPTDACIPYMGTQSIGYFFCDSSCYDPPFLLGTCDCICFQEDNRDDCYVNLPLTCEPACYDDELRKTPCDCYCYDYEDTTECVFSDYDIFDDPPNCKSSCYSREEDDDPNDSTDGDCDCICFQYGTEQNCIDSHRRLDY